MLQQTQVKTVLPFWERWMRELPGIKSVARASPERIHKLWEGLGYYGRARNMQKAARIILEKHGGKFPKEFDDVLALPGIGRYTAGAVCSIAFNQPAPVLDGNVIRVLTRIFGIEKNPHAKETNRLLWALAEKLVRKSQGRFSQLNQSLMELGALVCTPRNPKCWVCPAQKLCVARRENRVNELPNLRRRAKATARHFVAFVIEREGRFLVRQRPAGTVNAHLWEFPNVEVAASAFAKATACPVLRRGKTLDGKAPADKGAAANEGAADIFKSRFGFGAPALQPLATVKHSITRYRITLEAFRASLNGRAPQSSGGERWLSLKRLLALPFASAHRKILSRLQKI